MDDLKSIITYHLNEYGHIRLKFAEFLDQRGITRNQLVNLTGIKYNVIDRYYKSKVERVDLDFMAKMCFVLGCKIEDLLVYEEPKPES